MFCWWAELTALLRPGTQAGGAAASRRHLQRPMCAGSQWTGDSAEPNHDMAERLPAVLVLQRAEGEGPAAAALRKMLNLRRFAVSKTFRRCAASMPISSSFNMKGHLPILETDKGLEALQTRAPQLF